MPILKVLDLEAIQQAALAHVVTSHDLTPETVQLCLSLLSSAKKRFAWYPELNDEGYQDALGMIDMAISELMVESAQ